MLSGPGPGKNAHLQSAFAVGLAAVGRGREQLDFVPEARQRPRQLGTDTLGPP